MSTIIINIILILMIVLCSSKVYVDYTIGVYDRWDIALFIISMIALVYMVNVLIYIINIK